LNWLFRTTTRDTNLNWWPKNTQLRPQSDAIPGGFDWDLWLGVREPRPYLENAYHPKKLLISPAIP